MKVKQILTESRKLNEIKLDFNDLSSLHIAALKAIKNEKMDFENASERMMDIVYELEDYNLINSMYELTQTGEKALRLAQKLGGSKERRRASAKKDVNVNSVYDDDYGHNHFDGMDDEDMSIFQPNRFGSPNQNN